MNITARSTKAQLRAHIEKQDNMLRAQGRELEALRLQVSIAKVRVPTQTSLDFKARCESARALAMRTHRPVKVGA